MLKREAACALFKVFRRPLRPRRLRPAGNVVDA